MKNPFRSPDRAVASDSHRSTKTYPHPQHDVKMASQPLIALQLDGGAHWTAREFTALCREGYGRNPIVYRCVRMISEAAASISFDTRRDGKSLANDPAKHFLTRSHPQQSAIETFEAFYGYLQVGGNAYLEAILSSGVPVTMQALRPNQMKIALDRSGRILGWDHENGRYNRRFHHDAASGRCAVHHMRLFNPSDNCYGLSPLEAAAQSVDLHNQGGQWAKALLDNSARPSGALIYSGAQSERLTDDQFSRLKSELEHNFTGPRHAGRPMVLEGGLDWKSMSLSPADMDFTQIRREAARNIALAFGVPPMLLGIPGDNSYANYKEANQAFWRQTIIPLVRKTARGLEGWLKPYFGQDLQILANLDDVPALAEERATLWQRLSAAPFISDEERRAMAGLSPAEEIL